MTTVDKHFGDLIVVPHPFNPTRAAIATAPPLTRIALADLAALPHLTVDQHGINVAGQVWYTPVDVDPVTLTLICTKTRDLRPLVGQAKERRNTQ